MRHAKTANRLGRYSSWRKATVRDIAKATLVRQRICTTFAKAKEARRLVDRLITLGKKGSLAHRHRAFAVLCDHTLVSDLFKKIAPRFTSRQGGYTRIIPVFNRRGDNAQLVYLELTEKQEVVVSKARSSATSKAKKLDVTPSVAGDTSSTPTSEKEKKTPPLKPGGPLPSIKEVPPPDKGKRQKQQWGGIRKIFQRKTGE